jgi:hypothetical protein
MGKLKFRDFLNVDYAPGMPDIIKKNAKKRKADSGPSGSNAEYSSTHGPRTEKFDAYAALAKMAGTPKNPDKGSVYSHLAKSKDVQKAFKDKKLKKEQAEEELDEALTATQRRARARQMKRYKSRIKIGQEKAKRRMASQEKLQKRARKAARTLLFKKLTKGMDKSELTFQRRQEIEKRLDKMKSRIDKLAKKLLPQVRKAEMSRRQSQNKAAD